MKTNIKLRVSLSLMVFTVLQIQAQNCKTAKDPFSGSIVTNTSKYIELHNSSKQIISCEFKMIKENSDLFLEISYRPNIVLQYTISKENPIEISRNEK